MRNQKKQMIILLVILIIAVGAYVGFRLYNKNDVQEETSTTHKLTSFTSDDISSLIYDYDGEKYTLLKGSDIWICEEDKSLKLNSDKILSLCSDVSSITSEDEITDVKDYSMYGLDNPHRTIEVKVGNENHTIKYGDYNEVISKYYVCIDDNPNVYTTSAFRCNDFDVTPADLVEE